jgi:LPS export ABC transporter protein LptC
MRRAFFSASISTILFCTVIFCSSCSFDYSEEVVKDSTLPDLVFEDLTYTRMRDGEIVARLEAETGNRYEDRHLMELSNYKFEQYDNVSHEIDATGEGGEAAVDMVSNNVKMTQGVNIRVDSEDFSLRTSDLQWKDGEKILSGDENSEINITRPDGTDINGVGFHSDIRSRNWVFNSNVSGVYFYKDEEEDEDEEDEKESTDPK